MRKKLKTSKWNLRTKQEKVILTVMCVLFSIYAATLIYPFIWSFYNSLKTTREFNTSQFALPVTMKWENYVEAFSVRVGDATILDALFNSAWMTAGSVTLTLVASSLTSYVVAKYKFKFLSVVYAVAVFIQIIPLVGTMPAQYELLHSTLNIANKPYLWWVVWLGGFGMPFLMLYSAFKNVSWTYAEAAFIDGASNFRVFTRVMLPMIKPVLIAMAVVNAIGAWHDYMTSYMHMTDFPTLALAVYKLSSEAPRIGIPVYFAIILITTIPAMILFWLSQENIMTNMTTGGLKG